MSLGKKISRKKEVAAGILDRLQKFATIKTSLTAHLRKTIDIMFKRNVAYYERYVVAL